MNRVNLVGRVVRDIELRATQGGTKTCTFNLAVDRARSQDGTRGADFPAIVAWGRTAELCAQYLHKGDRAGVEGRIHTRNYEKNGTKVYVTEVVADRVEFFFDTNSQSQSQQYDQPQTGNAGPGDFTEVEDDELPF